MSVNDSLASKHASSSCWHRSAIVIAHSCHERVNINCDSEDPPRRMV